MKAEWGLDYDYTTDETFLRPSCPTCSFPVIRAMDGDYHCPACGLMLDLDEEMLKWLEEREGEKIEMTDCPKFVYKGHVSGCGGKGCVETHYIRNPVTLEWRTAWGKCLSCGSSFIV